MAKQQMVEEQSANVVDMFRDALSTKPQPQLSNDELIQLRQMMWEFAIIRAACPLAARALSARE